MKYIIWYDTAVGEYRWGNEDEYTKALAGTLDDTILAEEFVNTSPGLVEKITLKLNKNLVIVK